MKATINEVSSLNSPAEAPVKESNLIRNLEALMELDADIKKLEYLVEEFQGGDSNKVKDQVKDTLPDVSVVEFYVRLLPSTLHEMSARIDKIRSTLKEIFL